MKRTFAIRFLPSFASLLLAGLLAATSQASIIVINGSVTETFSALPPASNWSTTSGLFGAAAGSISNDASADTLVGPVTSSLLNAQFATIAGSTVVTGNQSRYYDGGFIGTTPTGVDATLTMVTLTNGTGINLSTFNVSYDLASQNAAIQVEDAIAGHRVYFSLTGNANSWNPVGNFGALGSVSFNAPVGTWAAGTDAYLLWLDDNSGGNPDGLYSIDNVRFTAVPEPSSYLLAMGALGLFGFRRLRKAGRKMIGR